MGLFAGIPKKAKESFTHCLDGKDTNIEKFINISGIYNSYAVCYIFYPNGLFVMSKIHISDKEQNLKDKDNYNYLLSMNKAVDGRTKDAINNFYRWSYWGHYIIEDNIIKVQMVSKPSPLSGFNGVFERWFKIIDKNTIGYLGQKTLDTPTGNDDILTNESPIKFNIPFMPFNNIPSFKKAWILKEKWFWCNEDDYKEFKKMNK